MITASHNPKEYIGMKLVRRQALPLSGDAGIGDIRDMVLADRIPPAPRSSGKRSHADILEGYIEHVFSFIDVEAVRPFDLVLDAGSGIAGLVAPPPVRPVAVPHYSVVLRGGRDVPAPRSESADRGKSARSRSARQGRRRGRRYRLGRRRRPLLFRRRRRRSSSPATSSRRSWPRLSCASSPARRSSMTSAPATR